MQKDAAYKKDKHEKRKEMVVLYGGLIIVIICIATLAFLMYQSMINKMEIPEYSVAFFGSITTLIIGYIFGKESR